MNMNDALNSRTGIALGLGLSRTIQPDIGYRMAHWVADVLSSQKRSIMVRSVRANQWIIHNRQVSSKDLDHLVRDTFRSAARSLYEFWHNFRDSRAVLNMVEFDPSFYRMMIQANTGQSGTLLVVPHISNFDLIGRAVVLRGLPLHILSYPQPPGGYLWQNHLREMPGLMVTPLSMQSLRLASDTLRANRTVITGVDRPLPEGEHAKYRSRFFGRLASMPVFHIRLALKHNIPITVLGGMRLSSGRYRLWASEPIPMKRNADLVQETVENAEAVLAVLAENIRHVPEQWAMFYPVWPEALDQVPA